MTIERSTTRRLSGVIRLQVANPWPSLIVPWVILAGAFLMTYLIWLTVDAAAGDNAAQNAFVMRAGVVAIVPYMAVVAIQAMNQTFRFALGHTITRRDYYQGTMLYFMVLSGIYGLGLTILTKVEAKTDGWGVQGSFFEYQLFDDHPWWSGLYLYAAVLFLAFAIGVFISAVFQRWKGSGVTAVVMAFGFSVVGAVGLLTLTSSWNSFGDFVGRQTLVMAATLSMSMAFAASALGFLVLRRVSPS